MVRTRKRATQKSPENNSSDIEEKKPKLEYGTTSIYFDSHKSKSQFEDNIVTKVDENEGNSSDDNKIVKKRSKHALKLSNESDSDESSSDEFMKAPFSLDDLGEFKTIKKEEKNKKQNREVICSSSVSKLSDDSDEEKSKASEEFYDFSQIIQSQQILVDTKKEQEERSKSKKQLPIKHQQTKPAKRGCKKRKVEQKLEFKTTGENEMDICELLAMGEGAGFDRNDSSLEEDEAEEVVEEKYSIPKEGVQVTIELPNVQKKIKSKKFDVEAAMKRRMNLVKKENQVLMHKIHLLCWISHCIHLNRVVNKDDLMGLTLSLIPSKHCYPPKYADLNYLEKLVGWFVEKVIVNPDHKLALNSSKLPLEDSLETQIESKAAFSLRDLVLVFVCMVRSLGMNARLVVSLRALPLRPPASDLCTVNNKPKDENTTEGSKLNKSVTPKKAKETQNVQKTAGKSKSIKPNSTTSKSKNPVQNLKSPEVRSPYFSSSDELTLSELKKNAHSKTIHKKESLSKVADGNKDKPLKNAKGSNSKERLHKIPPKVTSPYFNSESPSSSKLKLNSKSKNSTPNKLDLNNVLIVEELKTRRSSSRKPLPRTNQNTLDSESSEDEVEVPVKNTKSRKLATTKSPVQSKTKSKNVQVQDDDFVPPKPSTSKKSAIDRRVLSSDDEPSQKKIGSDYWAEVFLEAEEKWISVDLRKGKVHCVQQLYNGATQPVRYVLACNSDSTLKDVTRRYAPQWLTVTRRQRVDEAWWGETVAPYKPGNTLQDRLEDEDLDRQLHDKPLPTSVTEYKNHPLYALKRHLLKFEGIYPPDAPPLGFLRGEPVYSRGCVADLHTREAWIKEAKLVRRGEEPYKIVKARPKWDKLSQTVINDLPLPLFGHWQVEDYIPPPAIDGKVPRNDYGNVELYKPCMLPAGTVHLQVPQLARVARKLSIDCAPAVVGWEFSGGGSHPVLDGFIVCEEFKEVLLDAWDKEMDESAKRAKEKIEQRVYGNWKRLIKGLLIRERLKKRYDFGDLPEEKGKKKKQQHQAGSSKKS